MSAQNRRRNEKVFRQRQQAESTLATLRMLAGHIRENMDSGAFAAPEWNGHLSRIETQTTLNPSGGDSP